MKKSVHEEHLSRPLQTNIKQFKIAINFLTDIMDYSMLQTELTNSISQNRLLILMDLFKLLLHKALTKSEV